MCLCDMPHYIFESLLNFCHKDDSLGTSYTNPAPALESAYSYLVGNGIRDQDWALDMIIATWVSLLVVLFYRQSWAIYLCMHTSVHMHTHIYLYIFDKYLVHINTSNLIHPIGLILPSPFHYLYAPSSQSRTLVLKSIRIFTHLFNSIVHLK